MDTEGFEASGKSDAYDDRIFALSTFMSALLIYNLPETVRSAVLVCPDLPVQHSEFLC